MMKALITGITGQDGSYLTELLLEKGYTVHGIIRRASLFNTGRIDHLYKDPHDKDAKMFLHFGDMSDSDSLVNILKLVQPDEVYNLASMSQVRASFDIPEYTGDVTGVGVTRLLEALRIMKPDTKFYQASSSEMYGSSPPPQNEDTVFRPQSPYGCAKLYGYWMTKTYRTGYKMFASNGILFNHESPKRGETFVTKKIIRAAVRIKLGKEKEVYLGNLETMRDWGYAGDYVEAIYMILQAPEPDDWVVGTGENHTIREFAERVFQSLGLDFYKHCNYDPRYVRPNDVYELCSDSTKIRTKLGWKPKVNFEQLIEIMVRSVYNEEVKCST